jgi:hypothetical protein
MKRYEEILGVECDGCFYRGRDKTAVAFTGLNYE